MNAEFSKKVLTIGCECTNPKGGIAYVLNAYMKFIYSPFKFVANSGRGGFIRKLWMAFCAFVKCEWLEHIDKEIKFVHIHTASKNSFKRSVHYVKQAKRNGKKVILHIHGGGFKKYRQEYPEYVDKYLQMCDVVIALSETWKQYFIKEVGLQNVCVVNNIINYPKIYHKVNDGKFHLLFLGHVTETKGIFDLLETIYEHKEEWWNRIVLHIGGNGKTEKLVQKINEFGISDLVKYEGWVDGEKKSLLLSNADAFILPSYVEGVPISILEAMSYGIPTISTLVGGIPEIISDGKNGKLIKPGDKVSIYESINYLLNNIEVCTDMGMLSKKIADNFLPTGIEMQLAKMYNSIV